MTLVTSKKIIDNAYKERYAIGGFCAVNMEIIEAIIEAAQEENSPAIILINEEVIKYAGITVIKNIVKAAAEEVTVPIVLQLDHGSGFEANAKCVNAGFTSLMFDGSALPYEENIRITLRVVEMGHSCNIPVEGELGRVPIAEQDFTQAEVSAMKTQPEKVKEFVERTGIDTLSVALGSVHRMLFKNALLDIDLLKRIVDIVEIPIVLHGASGVTIDSIREGIENGIAKINVGTQIYIAFLNEIQKARLEMPNATDPKKILSRGKDAVKEIVKNYMRLFGCSEKADSYIKNQSKFS